MKAVEVYEDLGAGAVFGLRVYRALGFRELPGGCSA